MAAVDVLWAHSRCIGKTAVLPMQREDPLNGIPKISLMVGR